MQVFVVVGYNNTRVYDVVRLRQLAKKRHGAGLVLIAEVASSLDSEAADQTIVTSLAETSLDESFARVAHRLAADDLVPIGILPFSDRGILLGAKLCEAFRLPGPSLAEARVGIDKQVFRRLDQEASHPARYRPVGHRCVNDLEGFIDGTRQMGGKAFVKPMREGASRGCFVVHSLAECATIWPNIARYATDGLIVEELVTDATEYSWDYVAGASWITEKETTNDSHRAEIQQIVPAPLTPIMRQAIDAAGEHMRQLSSTTHGAYHNEVFLRGSGMTSAVEVNMRPAGMHIWDLAWISFADFDPWIRWLDWASGLLMRSVEAPEAIRYSGIRMLRPRKSGTVCRLPPTSMRIGESLIHEIAFSVQPGASVSDRIVDNHAFIGHIMASNRDYRSLKTDLLQIAEALENQIVIE